MKFWNRNILLSTALALFAMLFGSGNIAFPLGLGRDMGSMAPYAMLGFFITAALVPVLGVIAMALCNGDYRIFMERIGRIPARLVIMFCFALIGPFAIIPRCIAFAFLALQWIFPQITLLPFTIATACIILATTVRRNNVVGIMGKFLGPIKLLLLSAVIIKGLLTTTEIAPCSLTSWDTFMTGIFSGYGTLDLLGVIFSSGLLITGLSIDAHGNRRPQQQVMAMLVKSGILAAMMLGVLYAGFVAVASMQSAAAACIGAEHSQLLSILASIILGAGGGILASITMVIACATTAIGLTTMFAEYMSTELPTGMVSYTQAVVFTTIIATFFANWGASGIQAFISPIVEIMYPACIVLALIHIVEKTVRIRVGSWPFYLTLCGSIALRLFAC